VVVGLGVDAHALNDMRRSCDGPRSFLECHADVESAVVLFSRNCWRQCGEHIAGTDFAGISLKLTELFAKLVAELGRSDAHTLLLYGCTLRFGRGRGVGKPDGAGTFLI
jgi:hypothetical protein